MNKEVFYKLDGLTLQINLKSLCNLDCDYCLLPKHVKSQKETDDVIIQNTIELLEKIKVENLKIKVFSIFGAEPFTVQPTVIARVLMLVSIAFPTAFLKIQTNGTLCTPEYMKEFLYTFKNTNRFILGFSIDGNKKIHDKHRCNSYDKILKNFLFIKYNTNIKTNVICTVNDEHLATKENKQELLNFIEFMRMYNTEVNLAYADFTIRGIGSVHIGETNFSNKFAEFLIDNNLIHNCLKLFRESYCYRKGNNCDKILFDLNTEANVYQCEKEFSPTKEMVKWKDYPINKIMEIRHTRTSQYKIAEECNSCEYWEWCNGGCPLKRDKNGLALSCYVTKTVLNYIKLNINSNWKEYLVLGKSNGTK